MTTFPNEQSNAAGAIPAWVTDPLNGYYIKPNADGSINISGIAAATLIQSLAHATAAAPAYAEGTDQKLSQNLAGNLRTLTQDALTGVVLSAPITANATGAHAVVAADATHHIRVVGYVLTSNGNVDVKFQSAASDLTGLLYFGQHTNVIAPYTQTGWFQTAVNEALNINLDANIAVGGHVLYVLVP